MRNETKNLPNKPLPPSKGTHLRIAPKFMVGFALLAAAPLGVLACSQVEKARALLQEVDANGGEIVLDNGARLTIPEGAVTAAVTVGAEWLDGEARLALPVTPFAGGTAGPVIALTPHGQTFDKPVTVTMPFVGAGPDTIVLRLADESSTEWEPVGPITVDNGTISFPTSRFSFYQPVTLSQGCGCWSADEVRQWGVGATWLGPTHTNHSGDLTKTLWSLKKDDGTRFDLTGDTIRRWTPNGRSFTDHSYCHAACEGKNCPTTLPRSVEGPDSFACKAIMYAYAKTDAFGFVGTLAIQGLMEPVHMRPGPGMPVDTFQPGGAAQPGDAAEARWLFLPGQQVNVELLEPPLGQRWRLMAKEGTVGDEDFSLGTLECDPPPADAPICRAASDSGQCALAGCYWDAARTACRPCGALEEMECGAAQADMADYGTKTCTWRGTECIRSCQHRAATCETEPDCELEVCSAAGSRCVSKCFGYDEATCLVLPEWCVVVPVQGAPSVCRPR